MAASCAHATANLQDLWRDVVWCAYSSGAVDLPILIQLEAGAKVCQPNVAILVDEHIVRLDVSAPGGQHAVTPTPPVCVHPYHVTCMGPGLHVRHKHTLYVTCIHVRHMHGPCATCTSQAYIVCHMHTCTSHAWALCYMHVTCTGPVLTGARIPAGGCSL